MTPEPDCGHVPISGRVLGLLTSPAALQRLRAAYRADPVYEELRVISALVLASSERLKIALSLPAGDAGLMTSQQYAAAAGITARSVQRACRDGRIRARKVSGVWLIPGTELAARELAC